MTSIQGLSKLKRQLKRLENLPQKHLTKSVRKGASVVLKEAKANAPVESGDLKKGLKIYAERTKKRGKKVYDVRMDRKMNDVFVKISKDGKRAYYPASQEFGYFAKNGRYIPGFRFMRGSLSAKQTEATQVIVTTLSAEITKLTSGGS